MVEEAVVVVSVDTHAGPRLVEDLRPYCPAEFLDDFDAYAAEATVFKRAASEVAKFLVEHPNFTTPGHYDSAARLADYDYDGIAAGVIFHASENLEPMPFGAMFPGDAERSREHTDVGRQMYNRWLVDFVASAPHRHVGLAYLPMWDIGTATVELRWAHEHGLKAVNFPALKSGDIAEYNKPSWDPFWAACVELGMPLVTHVGVAGNVDYSGPEAYAIKMIESGGFFSHRAIWWLIFGGVFERFPQLKLMITETPGNWYPGLARELDAAWAMFGDKAEMNAAFLSRCPRRPSEYLHTNVFLGASFASPYEVSEAVANGFESQLTWGSDYPHVEGTFLNPADTGMPSVTRLALRNTFCGLDEGSIRAMVGANACDFFGLDPAALQRVATAIDAPTIEELRTPIDLAVVPAGASPHAFRSGQGGWS
jgi:predicted TIM-barrel fold metal-dependent hydrolase